MVSPQGGPWQIEFDSNFASEFAAFSVPVRTAIIAKLKVLEAFGPTLGRPNVDSIAGAQTPHLKELIVQVKGSPWRIFFAFSRARVAVLLCGGDKGPYNSDKWYRDMIALADKRARAHSF